MANYVHILNNCFPESEWVLRAGKDETVYANFEWITTPIPQATLDASECAVTPKAAYAGEVSFEDAFGQVLVTEFSKLANASNVWLTRNGLPSDGNPAIIPFNGKLVGIAFSNDSDAIDTDIEIYFTPKDSDIATLVYTWEFRNGQRGFTNETPHEVFESGAKVGVYLRKVGNSAPRNVDINVYLQVISADPETHTE